MKRKLIFFIFCCFCLIFAEFISYNILKHKQIKEVSKTDFNLPSNYNYTYRYDYFINKFKNSQIFREVSDFGTNHKILLFGCSYAFGSQLENEQTFGFKLAKKTNSKLYNRSFPGWTNTYMLYQIDNNDESIFNLRNLDSDIDNIIYIYMEDHKNRLNAFYWGGLFENIYNLQYKRIKKGDNILLVPKKTIFPFIHVLYISKIIHNKIENIKKSDNKKNIGLIIDIFKESHKKLAQKYPKAKFIIIEYNTQELDEYKTEIQNSGWELYSTFDIIGKEINLNDEKYHFKNDPHPKEIVWDIITDKYIEKGLI